MERNVGEIYILRGMCRGNQMGTLMDCGGNGKQNGAVTYNSTPQTFPNTPEFKKITSSHLQIVPRTYTFGSFLDLF